MSNPEVNLPAHNTAAHVDRHSYEHQQGDAGGDQRSRSDPSCTPSSTSTTNSADISDTPWWFASTTCPLVASIFGPMASVFGICALSTDWRVRKLSDTTEHYVYVEDPSWLIIISSISLGCALVANLCLLLNMARRIPFAVAQPITIIGWLISSSLLVGLLAATSSPSLITASAFALAQAFYYGIFAGALYLIVSSLIGIAVFGAYRGHYKKELRLSTSQRALMLQTMILMAYLLLGALVFSKIEGWEFLDSVYWADVTLLTIGLGASYTPKTNVGRGLLFPYALGGIIAVGLVVSSIRTLILKRVKRRFRAYLTHRIRKRVISGIGLEKNRIWLSLFHSVAVSEKEDPEVPGREQQFNTMREVQQQAERASRWLAVIFSATAASVLWFVGAAVFMVAEGWTYFESLYFTYTTLLTIGYGDYAPASGSGRAFFVFWSMLAVPTLTILTSHMGDTVVKAFNDVTIWIGSMAVLPAEDCGRRTFKPSKSLLVRFFLGRRLQPNRASGSQPRIPEKREAQRIKKFDRDNMILDGIIHNLEEEKVPQDGKEEEEGGRWQDREVRFYHYLLVRELCSVMKDIQVVPAKEYSYEEWAWYLQLLGHDEYASPQRRPNGNDNLAPEPGRPQNRAKERESQSWNWLGYNSPLMSSEKEAQWILEGLAMTLEKELRKMQCSEDGMRRQLPPVSIEQCKSRRVSKLGGTCFGNTEE